MTDAKQNQNKPFEAAAHQLRQTMTPDALWSALQAFEGQPFYTVKGLEFYYCVKGNELCIDRKENSITRATVDLAFRKVVELDGVVKGPKKLGVFGASYLYPVFRKLGIITD